MEMAPFRLDLPRAAILPTSVLDNNISVLIATVPKRMEKCMCLSAVAHQRAVLDAVEESNRVHIWQDGQMSPSSTSQGKSCFPGLARRGHSHD